MSNETPPAVPVVENFSDKPLATVGDRVLAALIDWVITIPFAFIPCAGLIICIAYGLTKDALPFLGGQSIGKKAMKIRAVTETGDSLKGNWGPAVIRQAVFFIPFFPIVELIVLCTNKDLRRLGDQWAKTKVVKVG